MTPTTAELLAELAAAFAHVPPQGEDVPPRTYSGPQIREAMNWGAATFSKKMPPLIAAGAVTLVKVRKMALDGRMALVTAYQFAAPAKKGKKVA